MFLAPNARQSTLGPDADTKLEGHAGIIVRSSAQSCRAPAPKTCGGAPDPSTSLKEGSVRGCTRIVVGCCPASAVRGAGRGCCPGRLETPCGWHRSPEVAVGMLRCRPAGAVR